MYRHPQLDQILAELRQALEKLYGERLESVILYGSQARGDAEEYSDIDVLVVLTDDPRGGAEEKKLSDLCYDLTYKYDTVIFGMAMSSARYWRAEESLLWNIHHDGVAI